MFYGLQKSSLADAIQDHSSQNPLLQVTTFSRLLTEGSKREICRRLNRHYEEIQLITLQQINTEEQFTDKIRGFLGFCRCRCYLNFFSSSLIQVWQALLSLIFGETRGRFKIPY
jgi:hypothetical protein